MQLEFFDVPSPCVGVCQSNEKGYCKGCFRTRDERQTWITLTSDDKQKVIKRCQQRKRRQGAVKKVKEPELETLVIQPSLLEPQPKVSTSTNDDIDFGDFEL